MEEINQIKNIVLYHKSEKCFKCGNLVEKNSEGYFKCECGFEWANLFIKRIPVDAFMLFKKFADANFCSDYGMCLRDSINSINELQKIKQMIFNKEFKLVKNDV